LFVSFMVLLDNLLERLVKIVTPRLTLDHVYIFVAVVLLALRPMLTPIPPNDFWWHMATGRAIIASGQIPLVDSFSYTQAGMPFFNQGWLAQVLMYGLYQAGGLPIVILSQALLIAGAYGLLLRLCIQRTGRLRMSVALLLLTTMPLSFDNWTVRPQSYVFPLFVGFLYILVQYRLGMARRVWMLPILMICWVNMHGSFVLGLALIALTSFGMVVEHYWGQRNRVPTGPTDATASAIPNEQATDRAPRTQLPIRLLLFWGAITALATLINPRGIGVLSYVRDLLSSSQVTSLVQEWVPPTIRDLGGMIFFIFLIGTFLLIGYARKKPQFSDLLLLLAFLWLALGAVRNIVWFGFIATPIVCVAVASLLPEPRGRAVQGSGLLNGVLVGLLGLLLLIGLPWFKPVLLPPSVGALVSEGTPIAAVRFMQSQATRPQRLFHEMGYGSYLIWAAPEQKVFIDPRIELYPFEQWRDYINLGQANNLSMLFERYRIDGALLHATDQEALVQALERDPAWQVAYRDEQTVYLIKR
jgi:hypothetical protein